MKPVEILIPSDINQIYIRKNSSTLVIFFKFRSIATLKPQWKSKIFYFQHLATPTSYFSTKSTLRRRLFRSVAPTFQYPRHRSQPPVLSANSLRWSAAHCSKMLSSYDRFIRKSQGAKSGRMMVGDRTLPIENASGACLLQLQGAAEHCHEEVQYLRTTFLVACSE